MLRLTILIMSCFHLGLASEVALGHADFLPSPTHPIGWMGDGSGRYPGATPPIHWDEASGKNMLWRSPMPMPSNAQPIIVGDKVFCLADPAKLLCLDVNTGALLWQRNCLDQIFPHLAHLSSTERETVEQAFATALQANYHIYYGGASSFVGEKSKHKWSEMWRDAAARIPNNQALQELCASLDQKNQTIAVCYNKGETNFREFTTDAILKQAKLPMGYEQEDFNWYTCTFVPPVSDGARIYVKFLHDTIVAFKLDGSHCWTYRPQQKRRGLGIGTNEIHLRGKLLYVPTQRKTLDVINTDTGKLVTQIKSNKQTGLRLGWGAGLALVPLRLHGEDVFLTTARRSDMLLIRAADATIIGTVSGGPGPGACGSYVVDNVLYVGHSAYGAKERTGVSAAELIKTDTGYQLKQKWRVIRGGKKNKDGSPQPKWTDPGSMVNNYKGLRKGRIRFGLTWRGLLVTDQRIFGCRDHHGVVQLDPRNGATLDICHTRDQKCSHTNEPTLAGGQVYVPTWSGAISVFDAKTGKLLAVNLAEPNGGSALSFQGSRLFYRGYFHLYAFGMSSE